MGRKKKIIIAEDQTLIRQGLRSLLSSEPELQIVAEAENGLDAIRFAGKYKPDLLLLDLAMPKLSGISALKEIKRQFPKTKILVLTFHTSEEYIREAFESGADGYCLKNDTHAELLSAINNILSGKNYLSPAISGRILEGYLEGGQKIKPNTSLEKLTQREKEVLKLVGEGYTSLEIGDILCISAKTVDKHRSNIMNKLKLHTASALTAYAIDKGLL
ncbi:MAG: response regulator transcription factor [Desulfobacteraceae bacterium]|jgi:DNA-binding NarL/FixJ family response regulator|nr:response regulator transcription factor [Desulfobacteraceae bacterium]